MDITSTKANYGTILKANTSLINDSAHIDNSISLNDISSYRHNKHVVSRNKKTDSNQAQTKSYHKPLSHNNVSDEQQYFNNISSQSRHGKTSFRENRHLNKNPYAKYLSNTKKISENKKPKHENKYHNEDCHLKKDSDSAIQNLSIPKKTNYIKSKRRFFSRKKSFHIENNKNYAISNKIYAKGNKASLREIIGTDKLVKKNNNSSYFTDNEITFLKKFSPRLQANCPVKDRLVMKKLNGCNMLSFLTSSNIDSEKKFTLCINVIDKLNEIHNKGWVHGDLNTKNVVITKEDKHIVFIDPGKSTHGNASQKDKNKDMLMLLEHIVYDISSASIFDQGLSYIVTDLQSIIESMDPKSEEFTSDFKNFRKILDDEVNNF